MKIGNPADKPLAVAPAPSHAPTAEAAKAGAQATGPAAPDASAKVELSSTASTLLSGGTSAEFDTAKVARVSQAIAGGTFKVNPEVIADKLISNAQELLTKVQR
jgi:negative regulator of flagellin synthesis FlgM